MLSRMLEEEVSIGILRSKRNALLLPAIDNGTGPAFFWWHLLWHAGNREASLEVDDHSDVSNNDVGRGGNIHVWALSC